MLFFPFFILLIDFVFILGAFISKEWVEKTLPSVRYAAEQLIDKDIDHIDWTNITTYGGSAARVDKRGNVTQLCGQPIFEKQKLTMNEWTHFLIECGDLTQKYTYSVAYEQQEEFWLVIRFPVSIRVQFNFVTNLESTQYGKAMLFFSSMVMILLLLLFLITLVYAKFSARAFITPLRQLCGMVKRINHGNGYDEEPSLKLSGEFLWLKNDISNLSSRLEVEKKQRKELEEDRKRMLVDISHDLRNPLATIMGYAETLCSESPLDIEKSHHYAQVIWKNSIRANMLLDDLFTYSKLEHPNFQLSLQQEDICEFVREQISLFFTEFEVAGMMTEFMIPETEIFLFFDKKLLTRVFSNLFTNSIRYNKSGVTLSVSLIEEADFVQIVLADDGVGMEGTVAETIFNPFTRGEQSRNSETGGSGLGLAIAKKIIDVHGGRIELVTALGEGCQFTIELNK